MKVFQVIFDIASIKTFNATEFVIEYFSRE